MKGKLITIEGVDGSGKSTQISMLGDYLKDNYNIIITQEPGGTKIGNQIRSIILDSKNNEMNVLTEVLLYAAARAQHVHEVIIPALDEGKIVLCSRFFDSTYAYQGYGAGLDLVLLKELNRITVGSFEPDLTIVFDLDPKKGLNRVIERNGVCQDQGNGIDRMESKDLMFHKRVRDGFLELARQNPKRMKIINASGNITDVFEKTKSVIEDFLAGSLLRGEIS